MHLITDWLIVFCVDCQRRWQQRKCHGWERRLPVHSFLFQFFFFGEATSINSFDIVIRGDMHLKMSNCIGINPIDEFDFDTVDLCSTHIASQTTTASDFVVRDDYVLNILFYVKCQSIEAATTSHYIEFRLEFSAWLLWQWPNDRPRRWLTVNHFRIDYHAFCLEFRGISFSTVKSFRPFSSSSFFFSRFSLFLRLKRSKKFAAFFIDSLVRVSQWIAYLCVCVVVV